MANSLRCTQRWAFLLIVVLVVGLGSIDRSLADDHSHSDDAGANSLLTDVITLTDDNFDEITETGSWLIEFYAPWCGHCKKLSPIWDEAARKLRGLPFQLGKVDATVEKKLAARFEIKSYPSIKFKRDKEVRAYSGARSAEAIIAFGKEMISPPLHTMNTQKQFKRFITDNPVVFALFAPSKSSEHALFNEVAFRLQGVSKFIHVPVDDKEMTASKERATDENDDSEIDTPKEKKRNRKKKQIRKV